MIHVLAFIELKPGTRSQFLAEFKKIVPAVRAEDGCIAYGAAQDVATGLPVQQIAVDGVVIVEEWQSPAHLKAHLAQPHMVAFFAATAGIRTATSVRVVEPIA